ncbi:MAG: FMN-binding negative transcriptional regulator [Actinobacteria bacterium]|nr:FMN-binding negative transcriptional regulator [Actinomycetota bacterium]
MLLDEEAEGLALVTHLGRPDEVPHELGRGEALIIVQGQHGYISPSWYVPGATRAPTWNFTVAHPGQGRGRPPAAIAALRGTRPLPAAGAGRRDGARARGVTLGLADSGR